MEFLDGKLFSTQSKSLRFSEYIVLFEKVKMTEHYNRCSNGANKRKCDATASNSSTSKRAKKDSKKSKSTREQDRILLENFVKYGILPPAFPKSGAKTISTTVRTQISPIRKHKRPSEDQRVPEIDRTEKETDKMVAKKTKRFWRPWLEPYNHAAKEPENIKNQPTSCNLPRKMPNAHYIKTNGTKKSTAHNSPYDVYPSHSCENKIHRSQESRVPITGSTTSIKSTSPTTTVTTWDTRSPEFLNSFKHPVRLMWPRSQAFDYKCRDAQELLHSFPVQAVIDFYEDQDGPDDKNIPPHHGRLLTSQRCTPVLN